MKKVLLCMMVALSVGVSQASIVIDDFTSGGWDKTYTNLPTAFEVAVTYNETGLADVYGGTRASTYTPHNLTATSMYGIGATLGGPDYPGLLNLNNYLRNWSDVALTYNGGGGAGGLILNLTSGTKFSIAVGWDHVGLGKNSVLSITLNDGSQAATVSKTWVSGDPIPTSVDFLLSSFAGVNMSSIDSIAVYMATDRSGDYHMESISTDAIPEPATMLLLGLGAVLLRKKK